MSIELENLLKDRESMESGERRRYFTLSIPMPKGYVKYMVLNHSLSKEEYKDISTVSKLPAVTMMGFSNTIEHDR